MKEYYPKKIQRLKQMAKPTIPHNKAPTCSLLCVVAILLFQILIFPLWSFTNQWLPSSYLSNSKPLVFCPQQEASLNGTTKEASDPTFYDDPSTSYTIDKPELDWDHKRAHWLKLHPTFSKSPNHRLLLITGSQTPACKKPLGDHYLLRFLKNKVDYCRINECKIFYNNVLLHPQMPCAWAKQPPLRAAMVAHPDVEWLFWMDLDAIFTDMDFKLPLEKYKDYNLVVPGWPDLLYGKKTWLGANAGVFLIRNCQWSMEFLDAWADMSPKSPDFQSWGEILSAALTERTTAEADDQSALVYLILKGEKKWREKIYVENDYALNGYWLPLLEKYEGIYDKYEEMERREAGLRRRHAEAAHGGYAEERGRLAEEGAWRRPFVTHFTGCQPCSGERNVQYEEGVCEKGMERALNFADDQVLRSYGFVHPDAGNPSLVVPTRFDHPAAA